MWMNVALLSAQCVTSMPIVRTLLALIIVAVKLDLLETEKHARVSKKRDTKVSGASYLSVVFTRKKSNKSGDSYIFY